MITTTTRAFDERGLPTGDVATWSRKETYMGLDLSLTGTGVSVVDETGVLVMMDEIKTAPHKHIHAMARVNFISDVIMKYVTEHKPSLIMIEDIFSGPNPSAVLGLASLHAVTKYKLLSAGYRICTVAASTNKKFLQSGAMKKNLVLKAVYQHYGVDLKSDNLADAYTLSRMSICVDSVLHGGDLTGLAKHKVEAVEKVLKEKDTRVMEGI